MKINSVEKLKFIIYLINVCYSVVVTVPSILTGKLLDAALKEKSYDIFIKYVVFMLLDILFIIVIGLIKNWIKAVQIKRARKELESLVFSGTMNVEEKVETVINAFDTEINLIINKYVARDGDYILIFVPFCIALLYSIVITFRTMFLIAISFLAIVLINQALLMPFSNHMKVLSKENENLNHVVSQYLKAITSIKIYGGINFASNAILTTLQERNNKEAEKKRYQLIIEGINCLFATLLQLVPLAVITYMVIESKISVGGALAIMLLLEKIVSPIDEVTELKEDKASASDAIKHVRWIINQNSKEKEDTTILPIYGNVNIVICNLTVRFGDRIIIDKFSHSFHNGKKYLIVGKNGVGKSTILKVLSRQITDYEGMIYVNGVELREIEREKLFEIIGVLPQFPEIFSDSIEHNIALGEEYDAKKILKYIDQLELGNTMKLMEDSIQNLSGGEKQRVAIARMLYHPKPVYLLDEVLCGLDIKQSIKCEKILLNLENTIIIHVSHRTPKDIRNLYDEIVLVSSSCN